MTENHNVVYGGEVVELDKEVIVDTEDMNAKVVARDRRSGLVDRTRKVRQVLCYICCAEFGTTSLKIHQKTCLKKHKWYGVFVFDVYMHATFFINRLTGAWT